MAAFRNQTPDLSSGHWTCKWFLHCTSFPVTQRTGPSFVPTVHHIFSRIARVDGTTVEVYTNEAGKSAGEHGREVARPTKIDAVAASNGFQG